MTPRLLVTFIKWLSQAQRKQQLIAVSEIEVLENVTVSNTIHKVCNFAKSNTPSWVLFSFLKLYK